MAEERLTGSLWTRESVSVAMDAIDESFAPLSDMRASADYRKLVARNLLLKFYLEHSAEPRARLPLRLDIPEGLRA
jgi:xanthine dehydrogenase small subunit